MVVVKKDGTEVKMLPSVVEKRDGTLVAFDKTKIVGSLTRLYLATGEKPEDEDIGPYMGRVCDQAWQSAEGVLDTETHEWHNRNSIHVEEIQDAVVSWLQKQFPPETAKAYTEYRERHKQVREQEIEPDETPEYWIKVVAAEAISRFAGNDDMQNFHLLVSKHNILTMVLRETQDEVSKLAIARNFVFVLQQLMELDPDISRLAAVFLDYQIHREMKIESREYTFKQVHAFIQTLTVPEKWLHRHEDSIQRMLRNTQPHFDYMGLRILYDRYLRRNHWGDLIETPAMMFMRVAMGIACNAYADRQPEQIWEKRILEKIDRYYRVMVEFKYMPSTPTLFNAGTAIPQLASCFLTQVPDDLDGIFNAIHDNAMLSKFAGGLGNAWSAVRGSDAHIVGTNGKSSGVVPFLNVADATALAVNQGGKRKGAVCAYLEPWHIDIEDFLDLRKNTGDERRRTPDMHTALWIPDLFMETVENDGEWFLLSPDEFPELPEMYGSNFNDAYHKACERCRIGDVRNYKTVSARKLWTTILQRLYETGHPWITFKDRCNEMSPQRHCGTIHSSNLCTEITLNTSENEIAVCNLGSINLAAHLKTELNFTQIKYSELRHTVATAVEMLNNVIDATFYNLPQARRSNQNHRPIGLGLMGWADVLMQMGYVYDSDEAMKTMDSVMSYIAQHAIDSSVSLACRDGVYNSFAGSSWSGGGLPIDNAEKSPWYASVAERYSLPCTKETGAWDDIRRNVVELGIRNSNLMAIAPTATIAGICGVLPSCEPQYSNYFSKTNMSGNFACLNKYLVRDLKQLDLWNNDTIHQLKRDNGSIQNMDAIPNNIKALYKTAFEVDQFKLIDAAAIRQRYIDQAQSTNLFVRTRKGREISDLYFHAWRNGLKTTYYMRTLPHTEVEKSSGENVGSLNKVAAHNA